MAGSGAVESVILMDDWRFSWRVLEGWKRRREDVISDRDVIFEGDMIGLSLYNEIEKSSSSGLKTRCPRSKTMTLVNCVNPAACILRKLISC